MFLNRGFAPHDLVKALQDGVIELLLAVCSQCLAAVLLRSLLTVTPSADLHHITKHFTLFPADRMASQNNHQEDYQSVLNASSGLLNCSPQHLPHTAVLLWETFKFLLCNFVWHSGWLVIDHLLRSTFRKCTHYASKIFLWYTSWGINVQNSVW